MADRNRKVKKRGSGQATPCAQEKEFGRVGDKKHPWRICRGTLVPLRKTWSRMIHKFYEVNLLTCPKCQAKMRVVAFIEDPGVVKNLHSGRQEYSST